MQNIHQFGGGVFYRNNDESIELLHILFIVYTVCGVQWTLRLKVKITRAGKAFKWKDKV